MPDTKMSLSEVHAFLSDHLGNTVHVRTTNGYDSRNADHRAHRFVRFDHSNPRKTYACFATLPLHPDTWTVYYDIAEITHVAMA